MQHCEGRDEGTRGNGGEVITKSLSNDRQTALPQGYISSNATYEYYLTAYNLASSATIQNIHNEHVRSVFCYSSLTSTKTKHYKMQNTTQ